MKSAKECVTTHLPNEFDLKIDGAQALLRSRACHENGKVGGRSPCVETFKKLSVELGEVQILVTVAMNLI